MNISIYFAWYTFYGQFEFLNQLLLYYLDLTCDGYSCESPWKGIISFDYDRVVVAKWIFLLSGLWWDFIIVLIIKNLLKSNKT
jgi:hypothetical protein